VLSHYGISCMLDTYNNHLPLKYMYWRNSLVIYKDDWRRGLVVNMNTLLLSVYSDAALLVDKFSGSRDTDKVTSPVLGPLLDGRLKSSLETSEDDILDPSSAVFIPRPIALSLLRSRRQVSVFGVAHRRGLNCECCQHSCSIGELMEYCRWFSAVNNA